MIRWTFYFMGEGNVKSDILTDEEDDRIERFIELHSSSRFGRNKTLKLPAPMTNIHINLDMVKCITREMLDDNAPPPTASDALPVVEATTEAPRAA